MGRRPRDTTSGTAAVTVVLPAPLRALTGGAPRIRLAGRPTTLRDALSVLREDHPAVHARLVTEQGVPRRHVNVFVDGEDVRRAAGLDTPLGEDAEILVLPAVSGG